MFKVVDFTTDCQENPIGIAGTPMFGWRHETDAEHFFQQSYRILVASAPGLLVPGKADLWDSGVVRSERQTAIRYEGKKIASMRQYYVKCLVSAGGHTAESAGTFETGLLDKSDWKGRWVSMPVNYQGGGLCVRKVLPMPQKPVKSARAYVCGLGYHEVYVNGKRIGDDKLVPGMTQFDRRVVYNTYDITACLDNAQNVFGVLLGHGWYGARKLLAQIYVTFADGELWEDHTVNFTDWWVGPSAVQNDSIYGGEVYDARLEEKYPDWASRTFTPNWDNGWFVTILTDAPAGVLTAQDYEPVRVIRDYKPVAKKDFGGGNAVFDFGQNFAGWAEITVKGEKGAKVSVIFSEELKEDGHLDQLNLRSARSRDLYILKGGETETYEPRFTFHGFRYAEVTVEGKAKLLGITGRHLRTAVKKTGEFECSDAVLNRLHQNAAQTDANNMHSVMSDCPQRDERFGWLNDLNSRVYQSVYNYDMRRLFPKIVRDIADTQDKNGAIGDTAPFYLGARPADPICISYLLIGLACYRNYGDEGLLRRHYDGFKAWTDCLLSYSKDFVMNYYLYADWVAPYADIVTDGFYVSSIYLFWHLERMCRIAEIVGNEADRKRYSDLKTSCRAALNAKYFDEKTNQYCGGTQAANAMALSIGLVTEGKRSAVAKNIADDMVARGYHSSCGNQGYRHLFYAMSDNGYMDLLVKTIKNPEYPGWGFMIASGATTVWERWEKEVESTMNSFDHPMFGAYDAWLYHYIAGIRIAETACDCDRIEICPVLPEALTYVKSSLTTSKGKIVSNWEKLGGGKVRYDITIPPNTHARLSLHSAAPLEVGSGVYSFLLN